MKVCYVSSARIPSERPHAYATAKMCEAFAELGHEVNLISPDRPSTLGDDPFEAYDLKRNFSQTRVPSSDLLSRRLFSGALGFWADLLFFAVSLLVRQRAALSEADIVYTRDIYLALFLPRHKTILELHTLPARSRLLRGVLESVRGLSAISRGLAEDIQASCSRSDIIILPDAVDFERFSSLPEKDSSRAALGIPEGRQTVLYTGNFYPWKGADTLADAAGLLPEQNIVLVGGTDEYDFQRVAKKAGLAPNLIVRRFEPQSRMPLYLAASDVLVIPNAKGSAISERHTSPLKLFEYMATGKPIVASDIPSLREILDEESAIFFSAGDAVSLAAAIRSALAPDAAALGYSAQEKAAAYSWHSRGQRALSGIAEAGGARD